MNRRPLAVAAVSAACLAATAVPAFAHDATVVCDRTTGTYRVTADYLQFNPTWTFTASTVVVRWSDGFRLVRQLPMPCQAPPPVEPPPPVVVPPPPVVTPPPPPVVTPPPPVIDTPPVEPMPRKTVTRRPPVKVTVRIVTVRRVPCTAAGDRTFVVTRKVTTTSRGGKVIRRVVGKPVRSYGAVCAFLG
jgi:hypothetical protein